VEEQIGPGVEIVDTLKPGAAGRNLPCAPVLDVWGYSILHQGRPGIRMDAMVDRMAEDYIARQAKRDRRDPRGCGTVCNADARAGDTGRLIQAVR
jgi:hypothetical protein